jgi:DNA-binding HxlR family transcriptional regulator
MSSRSYGESCALAHGLDLVGDRWTLLVIRELMFGPRRFTDIQRRLSSASSSVLADRLQRLVESELVEQRRLPAPAASSVYELTTRGRDLRTTLHELARWGLGSPSRRTDLTTTPAAVALAVELLFDPARARGVNADIDLEVDNERFRIVVRNGTLEIGAPRDTPAAATIRVGPDEMRLLVSPDRPHEASEWIAAGVTIEGDQATAVRVLQAIV